MADLNVELLESLEECRDMLMQIARHQGVGFECLGRAHQVIAQARELTEDQYDQYLMGRWGSELHRTSWTSRLLTNLGKLF